MIPPTRLPLQVAFLTGQSDPRSAALSPAQAAFLAALPLPDAGKVALNFPYPAGASVRPFSPVALLVASVRNARQHLASRRPAFAEVYRRPVAALLARADRTLFLAGSCGLELFNNLLLPAGLLRRVTILAYGPVARRRPDCACLLVQGRRDWLSRRYFRRADTYVDAGHMDYLACPAVLALARERVARLVAAAGTLAAVPSPAP